MDDDKLLFFQEYWEERRLKAGPVRCESLCATGNGNPKGYSGILRCVTAKDINPLFFPHSFRQERDFGRGGVGARIGSRSSEDSSCSSDYLEGNFLQKV